MNSDYVTAELVCHPETPTKAVKFISASVERQLHWLYVKFIIEGDTASIRLPPPVRPSRCDGLWKTTCCEMFTRGDGTSYREFNFSPSGAWADYGFSDYREGMEPLELDAPLRIIFDGAFADNCLYMSVLMPEHRVQSAMRVGLSAVIEEEDGAKSYWALAHPHGKPDFHHPDCFALTLPAIGQP